MARSLGSVIVLALLVPGVAVPLAGAVGSAALGAAPVARSGAGELAVRPASTAPGERVVVRGSAAPADRPVRLEVRRGSSWRVVDRGETAGSGDFRLAFRPRADTRVRVTAPRSAGAARWTSRRSRIDVVAPTVSVTTPGETVAGTSLTVTGRFEPARPGRRVLLQERVGGRWVELAAGKQRKHGSVSLRTEPRQVGTHTFRMTAVAHRGARAVRSSPRRVVVLDRLARDLVPRLDIVTDDGAAVTSGDDYRHASLTIDPRGSGLEPLRTTTKLRVRGNSTAWIRSKLSYKVKLDEPATVLGMPSSKKWVLLANFYDRSMLRNAVAFEAAGRVGLPWSPRLTDVEVWLNGKPAGLYQFGEGIEIESARVDLDTDDGGFLLEGDSWTDDGPVFTTGHGLQLYVKEPEDVDASTTADVAAQVEQFEAVLYGSDYRDPSTGYRAHADVDSFIDWWLVNELMKNIDSAFNNSIWMDVDPDGRIGMGPVWDFDQAAGNRTEWGVDRPTGWLVRRNWYDPTAPALSPTQMKGPDGHWLNRMFTDPWFVARADARWQQVRDDLVTLPAFVTARSKQISDAAARNFSAAGADLPIGPTFMDQEPSHVFHSTWWREVEGLRVWLRQRIAWMDQHLGG